MKGKRCIRKGCKNKAVNSVYGILPCKSHQEQEMYEFKKSPEFYSLERKDRIDSQRDKHSKDFLQPFTGINKINRDFAKAYPNKVKDYYTTDQLKKL